MISKGVRYMIFAIAFLAVMQAMVKALPNIPITQLILARAFISIILCYITLSINKTSLTGNYPLLVVRGIVGTTSLLTYFYTIQNMPLASAVTIAHLSPLFLGVMAMLFLKEKMSNLQWLSFLISFTGVFLIKGFDPRVSSFMLSMAVLSSFLAASAHFFIRVLKDENPLVVLFYFNLIAIVMLLPYTIMNWVQPDFNDWMLMIVLAVASHIGQYFLTSAFKLEEISNVAGVYYLGIIMSISIGYFVYNETFSLETYFGMFLIMSGVFIALIRNRFIPKTGKI